MLTREQEIIEALTLANIAVYSKKPALRHAAKQLFKHRYNPPIVRERTATYDPHFVADGESQE